MTLFNKLEDCANLINQNYNNLLCLEVKFFNLTLVKTLLSAKATALKNLNIINLNFYNSKYTLKNSTKKQKQIKKNSILNIKARITYY